MTKSHRRLALESLEARALLATADGVWPNPRELTLSFAPDATQIGLYQSELFAALGRNRNAAAWQTDVLKAFQTWAAVANVDFGLVPDTGRRFGVAGLAQGDPRFGDIRLGAFPQPRVLANTVPYRAVAGSWSGDVFLNSSLAAGLQSAEIDLYSVMLNEAGNALGLADNDNPASAMYTDYLGRRVALAAEDIAAIVALYGERQPDANDAQGGNDSAETATVLASDTTTFSVEADLHRAGDVDYYRVPAAGIGGQMSVRLVAAGESLLVAAVDVRRIDGTNIASAAADGPLSNNVGVAFPMLPNQGDILIRVAGKSNDVFGTGRYRLEINTRSGDAVPPPESIMPTTPEFVPTMLPSVAQSRVYPAVAGFLDDEVGQNDTTSTATALETPFGYVSDTRYEAVGSIRAGDDVDVYRILAPTTGDRRLTVFLDTFDVRLLDFHAALEDASGNAIVAQTAPQADGRMVLDVADISPGETYFLSISAGGPGGSSVGNYVVVADFLREDPFLVEIGSGTFATPADQRVQLWHSTRTLLYRFDLRPEGGATGAAVRFEIRAANGQNVVSLLAPSGATSTKYVWLSAGSFDFTIRPEVVAAVEFLPIDYKLSAAALSDDVGPGLVDPTENPLPGDADHSGVVDRGDVAAVAADFGSFVIDSLPSLADFDGDGDVDLADLLTVATNFGRALLPDLSTSTATGGGSVPTTQAPSAIVVSATAPQTTDAKSDETVAASGISTRRLSRGAVAPLVAILARRPSPPLADAVLGDEFGPSPTSKLFATGSATRPATLARRLAR